MYYSRFGLNENPFGATPNPRYLYLSRGHREAMDHLIYGIRERKGFIMITGGVGTGKTTLLRSLLSEADESMNTALLLNPFLSEEDLLPAVCAEFGIPAPAENSKRAWLAALNDFLIASHVKGRLTVLLLDEAQNLSREVLEEARILSNLETDREKLLQIVLTGQEELVHLLARPELRQLNERIVVRYHLGPLEKEDVRAYVQHRMAVAGNRGGIPFSRDALKALHSVSAGIPRRINAVCDRAFLAAYSRNRDRITGSLIKEAARETGAVGASSGPVANRRFNVTLICALALMIAIAGGVGLWAGFRSRGAAVNPVTALKVEKLTEPARPSVSVAAPAPSPKNHQAAVPSIFPWVLNNAQSIELLYGAAEQGGLSGRSGLFSFQMDISRARRLVRPFRAALSGLPAEGFAVIARATPTGFSVLAENGGSFTVGTEDLARYWTGSLTWLVPENFFPASLGPGSRGPEVARLQDMLTGAGYTVAGDGLYGRRTVEAMKRFQADFGINPDGVSGFDTIRVLYQASGK